MYLPKVIRGVGGFDHEAWRTFTDMHRSEPCRGFVDGDLIEQFLDLPAEQAREVSGYAWACLAASCSLSNLGDL